MFFQLVASIVYKIYKCNSFGQLEFQTIKEYENGTMI